MRRKFRHIPGQLAFDFTRDEWDALRAAKVGCTHSFDRGI
jgi:hypothetical protein